MSLQVWLPLVGNLQNRGLTDTSFTSVGASVHNGGKIGQCYSFNGSSNYLYAPYNFYKTSYTVAGWIYTTSSTATQTFVCDRTAVGSGFSTFLIGGKLRIDAGGSNLQWTTNYTYPTSTWFHLAVVYNDTTVSYYINGEFKESKAQTISSSYWGSTTSIGASQANGSSWGNYLLGRLNDVRIYDHALSPMEVHEIAQAKLIHLKLSDPYVEATTNLATDNLSNTCYNGATNKYSYGTNTDMYKDDGYYQGRTCTRVRMGTNGLDAYPYVYFDAFNATGTTIQTLSFDYFPTIQTVLIPYSYNGAYNWFWSNGETSGTTLNAGTCASIPVKLYQWNHITVTAVKYNTTSTARGIGYIRIGSAKHTSNIMNYWLFANVQVEAKDHETGWTALNTTRDAETLVDSSGYLHNAIPNALTTSSDTPMYSLSTVFNGSSGYAKVNDATWMADGMTDFTVSIWMKASSWPSQIRPYCCLETGGFGLGNAGSSGYYRFYVHEYQNAGHTTTGYDSNTTALKISALSTTNWNHVVIVHTNSYTKTYVNGTLHNTYTRACYGVHFNTAARLFIGCEAGGASATTPYFNGQLSDFRFYATALSDDDIMRLYKSRGFVDDIGNVYIGEAKEL